MKALPLLCVGLFVCGGVGAQNPPDSSAPAPVIITPGQSDTVLEELSPPLRPGRRGGVYVTGASPAVSGTNAPIPVVITSATNGLFTNAVGATGGQGGTNVGAGANYGPAPMLSPSNDFIFVPTFNQPGLPGAIGGRGFNPASGASTTPTPPTTAPNSGIAVPNTSAVPPAGTVSPALPPAGTTTVVPPPAGPGTDLPGSRVVTPPPPITAPPPPISGRR